MLKRENPPALPIYIVMHFIKIALNPAYSINSHYENHINLQHITICLWPIR
jgi:hypothetical protein